MCAPAVGAQRPMSFGSDGVDCQVIAMPNAVRASTAQQPIVLRAQHAHKLRRHHIWRKALANRVQRCMPHTP